MLIAQGTFIGYVQANLAVMVAERLDNGESIRAHVSDRQLRGIPYVTIE
jgi:hypothetical protein